MFRLSLNVCRRLIKPTRIVRPSLIPSYIPRHRHFHTSTRWLQNKTPIGKVDKPMMMIAFTCKKCNDRSSHTMSKQAYTKGTVLIQCPSCQVRHLIADHLKIFSDEHITIEDILRAKGESASLTADDLAFEDIPESLKDVLGKYAKDKKHDDE
ncbi:hypothetical protein ZYGR_0I01190 [Zygosaccharomyces rouxii]|uniref:ZYRO0C02882p n=2 Tax=Zygosaccharomyces rouxii TaxID=4956 RepID=C5DST6_ZYGRC|nr:uncharacterized protein ZYRO0C02882g [Zygosaccharomyces rouxii]KAH9201963.1 DNL zinc finger-domain-containing protein [Zygosaccharomyces rouxii]GAV47823.1 hypothetical protein ZYGR_0I01190 [Zygosaccharomyces rouxii]CAR26847.1 ZYRO0C02882p [Zygosaccharomyces rouxii]